MVIKFDSADYLKKQIRLEGRGFREIAFTFQRLY